MVRQVRPADAFQVLHHGSRAVANGPKVHQAAPTLEEQQLVKVEEDLGSGLLHMGVGATRRS